jgi:lipoate-protein ligase A
MTDVSRAIHVFRDPALDGPTNMARDEHLLYSEEFRPAAVRIYAWSPPTISLGCFQRFARVAELPEDVRELAVVRRPTGGGAILHDREVTYCLVIDDTLPIARKNPIELYRLVHTFWREALEQRGLRSELAPEHYPSPSPRNGPFFCFQELGRTDLLVGGEKLLGSAQRRIPGRVLQHGSLLLGRRFPVHPGADLGEPEPRRVEIWVEGFLKRLARGLALKPCRAQWASDQAEDIERRRERYASDAWTRQR